MANETADGSVVIDTELDNSGFSKGVDKILRALNDLTGAVDVIGDNMMRSFSQTIPLLSRIASSASAASDAMVEGATRVMEANTGAATATQQATQAAQRAAQQTENANERVTASEQSVTQAVQDSAAATDAARQSVAGRVKDTADYNGALTKMQARIDTAKAKLADYYKAVGEIKASTDDSLSRADTDEQAARILEIEQIQLQKLNDKYAVRLETLSKLETEYARIAALTGSAGNGDPAILKTLTTDIQKASTDVDRFEAKVEKMSTLGASESAWKTVQYDIDTAREKLDEYRLILEALKENGGVDTESYARLSSVLDSVGAKQAEVTAQLPRATSAWTRFGNSIKSALARMEKTVFTTNALVKALTSIKSLLKTRIKRMFISAIINGVKESLQTLAKFSSTFDGAMSNVKNRAKELSANISVAFAGLIKAVEPILTRIISAASRVVSYLNAFFAMLSGKSTITVAKKQTQSYAESLKSASGAAEDLKKQVYGFDKLNKKSSKNTGGASDGSDLFEEVPVDALLPDTVKNPFQIIKDAIANGDWRGVGEGISSGLNTAVQAINGWMDTVLRPEVVKWFSRIGEIFIGLIDGFDWSGIGQFVTNAITVLLDGLLALVSNTDWGVLVQSIIGGIGEALGGVDWGAILSKIGALVIELVVQLPSIIIGALGGVCDLLSGFFSGIGLDAIAGFFKGIGDAMRGVGAWLKENLVDPVINWVKNLFGIHSPSIVFADIGTMLIRGLLNGISNTWRLITQFFTGAFTGLKTSFSSAWDAISSAATTAWTGIKNTVSAKFTALKSSLSTTTDNIKSALSTAWGTIKSTATTAWTRLKSSVSSLWTGLKSNLRSVSWSDVGTNLVSGLRSGISSTWNSLTSFVGGLARGLTNSVKSIFGIHSPSKVWAGIGEYLDAGLQEGIEGGRKNVLSTVSNLAKNLNDTIGEEKPELAVSERATVSGLDAIAARLSGIASTFRAITSALEAMGGLRVPQIAAGTVIPVKTRIDTAPSAAGASDGITELSSNVDERMADISYLLKQLVAIVKALNLNIDINALTDMVTRQQQTTLRNFGGV